MSISRVVSVQEIADRLGVARTLVLKNVNSADSGIFDTGHASEEIARRLGWPLQKKAHGGDRRSSAQSEHLKTAERIGEAWEKDVSRRYVFFCYWPRDGRAYRQGVRRWREDGPPLREDRRGAGGGRPSRSGLV